MTVLKMTKRNTSDLMFNIIVYGICILVFLIVAYPLYFIVIASISNSNLVSTGQVVLFPKGISLYGYKEIFQDSRIWIGYRNTIIYSFGGTLVNLLFTLPAAYVLSRRDFRAKRPIMFFFVFTMFFNGGLIPTYLTMKQLHMIDTMWVFIFNPLTVNVFNLIITRTFFETSIPHELYESAQLDGCTHFTYFTKIVLPLSKAIVAVVGLYYLVFHWNDFFTGLIYINSDNLEPLQNVLNQILLANDAFSQGAGAGGSGGGVSTGYAQQFADQIKYGVIIVSTLPVLIVYPFIQKYFEKGVMIGSIKG
jgi:putative aldouronate transport system permease protein